MKSRKVFTIELDSTDNKKYYTDVIAKNDTDALAYIQNQINMKTVIQTISIDGQSCMIRGGNVVSFRMIQERAEQKPRLDNTVKKFLIAVILITILGIVVSYIQQKAYYDECNSYGDGTTTFSKLECKMIMEN